MSGFAIFGRMRTERRIPVMTWPTVPCSRCGREAAIGSIEFGPDGNVFSCIDCEEEGDVSDERLTTTMRAAFAHAKERAAREGKAICVFEGADRWYVRPHGDAAPDVPHRMLALVFPDGAVEYGEATQ